MVLTVSVNGKTFVHYIVEDSQYNEGRIYVLKTLFSGVIFHLIKCKGDRQMAMLILYEAHEDWIWNHSHH